MNQVNHFQAPVILAQIVLSALPVSFECDADPYCIFFSPTKCLCLGSVMWTKTVRAVRPCARLTTVFAMTIIMLRMANVVSNVHCSGIATPSGVTIPSFSVQARLFALLYL